jgi:L-asparagine transporter-like permease
MEVWLTLLGLVAILVGIVVQSIRKIGVMETIRDIAVVLAVLAVLAAGIGLIRMRVIHDDRERDHWATICAEAGGHLVDGSRPGHLTVAGKWTCLNP